MRVILDTNVLLSAVMKRDTPPARLYQAWREGRFELVSCELQLAEIRAVSRRSALRQRLRPARVGGLINELRHLAVLCEPLSGIAVAEDPDDDFLLGLAVAGSADYLVTGRALSQASAVQRHPGCLGRLVCLVRHRGRGPPAPIGDLALEGGTVTRRIVRIVPRLSVDFDLGFPRARDC